MINSCYIYCFKQDLTCEAIGRVTATSLDDARSQIAIIKNLSIDLIDGIIFHKIIIKVI